MLSVVIFPTYSKRCPARLHNFKQAVLAIIWLVSFACSSASSPQLLDLQDKTMHQKLVLSLKLSSSANSPPTLNHTQLANVISFWIWASLVLQLIQSPLKCPYYLAVCCQSSFDGSYAQHYVSASQNTPLVAGILTTYPSLCRRSASFLWSWKCLSGFVVTVFLWPSKKKKNNNTQTTDIVVRQ